MAESARDDQLPIERHVLFEGAGLAFQPAR